MGRPERRLEEAEALPVIDLSAEPATWSRFDQVRFEDTYAQLAFGLGIVPRRRHAHDPLWQQPAALLLCVAVCILVVIAST